MRSFRDVWSQRGIALGDQALSSVSNALAVILVARSVSAAEFGRFALAYAVLTIFLGASRSYFGTRVSLTLDASSAHRVTRDLLGAIVLAAPLTFLLVLGISTALAGTGSMTLLVVVALATPVVCLQDVVRFGAVAAGRPSVAAASDALWAVSMAVPVVLQLSLTLPQVMAVWLGSGVAALALALVGFSVAPSVKGGVAAWRTRHRISESVTYSILVGSMGFFAVLVVASQLIGPEAAGSLRGASTTLGPVSVLFSFVAIGLTPTLVRRSRRHDLGFCIRTAAATAGFALAFGLMLLALPTTLGVALFGQSWSGIREILPWTVGEYVVSCVAVAAQLGLRVRHCPRQIRWSKTLYVAVMLTCGTASAAATGQVWAVAASLMAAAAVLALTDWLFLLLDHRDRRRHDRWDTQASALPAEEVVP